MGVGTAQTFYGSNTTPSITLTLGGFATGPHNDILVAIVTTGPSVGTLVFSASGNTLVFKEASGYSGVRVELWECLDYSYGFVDTVVATLGSSCLCSGVGVVVTGTTHSAAQNSNTASGSTAGATPIIGEQVTVRDFQGGHFSGLGFVSNPGDVFTVNGGQSGTVLAVSTVPSVTSVAAGLAWVFAPASNLTIPTETYIPTSRSWGSCGIEVRSGLSLTVGYGPFCGMEAPVQNFLFGYPMPCPFQNPALVKSTFGYTSPV